MNRDSATQKDLKIFLKAIVSGEIIVVQELISKQPALARCALAHGATRSHSVDYFFEEIRHYLYAGDTPLHAACAACRPDMVSVLIENGAVIDATNRRKQQAIHYACDSGPLNSADRQTRTIELLIEAGADPNCIDMNCVTPLHRAVRSRSLAAVSALLFGGANVGTINQNGSTPLHLAVQNTGASGSGSAQARSQQEQIITMLLKHGADPAAVDIKGKTVYDWARDESLRQLLK